MRLLRRLPDGTIRLTHDLPDEKLPKYAILSHTWITGENEEVIYNDMNGGQPERKAASWRKIVFCSNQARKDGLEYFWVDTCCIDKQNAVELQEAITSMFSWYQNATKCYAYLHDVSVKSTDTNTATPSWIPEFRRSRWFTRGWTLQELLAPLSVEFFDRNGAKLGDKTSLESHVQETTGIPYGALRGDSLASFTVAERFTWTENRQTTRKEDNAYCLLGIFNVFMPLIYGEGDHAFTRLREEIDKKHSHNAKIEETLSTLPIAAEAAFNSLNNQHEPTCLSNTRSELLQDISEWAVSDDDKCIFWLNGIAGTGKSTIARTVARSFYDRGILGASFFFSRGGGDLGNANRLVTTLARQLAFKVPAARHYICDAVLEQTDIAEHSLRDQWEHLIVNPLSKLSRSACPPTVVIIIDALDECDSEKDIRVILRVLATARAVCNMKLRIFITSRPEIPIRHGFAMIPDVEQQVFILHEISPDVVDRDLSLYFRDSFSVIREERGYSDDWPDGSIIKRLVDNSCGLFIWASTACRFIREGRRLASKRISTLLNGHQSGAGPEQQLDQIYTSVLQDSIQQDYNDKEKVELYDILREVLGSIVILYSPLSMHSLANLLSMPLREVQDTLADLHTIFNIPRQSSRPVRLHHPTFRDFLLDKTRCRDPDLWVDEKEAHKTLADSCIALMSKRLKTNICSLGSPGTLAKDVNPGHVQRWISPELQYACLYWAQHYQKSGARLTDGDRVHRFLEEHLLHWLEALSLIGKSSEMTTITRLYHSLLVPSENERQMTFIADARRLIFTFQSILKQAPLQIYCTALIFIQPNSSLKQHFKSQLYSWIKNLKIAEANVPKAKDELFYVNDLVFTPDSSQVASGSVTGIARLWDTGSSAAIRKFEGAKDRISSVAISPDGKTIAAGSDDFTVLVWDLETGSLSYTLPAHTRWVNSVVFSPDGKLLASGSMDETLALWDVETGQAIKRFENQSSCVNDAAFSPDGSMIATASFDQVVRIWDIKTGEIAAILDGHSDCVNSAKFSPNGKQVLSGSDDMTIRLWDIASGTGTLTIKGHSMRVRTVTFSMDASLIVSGSDDKTVKIWDAVSGALLHTLTSHTSGINAVAFSPNGRILASCSFDDEVRLWDTKTWESSGKLEDFADDDRSSNGDLMDSVHFEPLALASRDLKGHSKRVTSMVVSPNGQLLVSGSDDSTIKLWLMEGVEVQSIDVHSGTINDLAFSPDNHLVASATADGTVGLWDTATGETIRLEGHRDEVFRVAFSPDGSLMVSCSADTTIRIWRAATGESAGTLSGHSDKVIGIVFSPDGRFLISTSSDGATLLWYLATQAIFAVLKGHTGIVTSAVYSSDGDQILTCSEDNTIRLWTKEGTPTGIIKYATVQFSSVAFSPDNRMIASSSQDQTIRLWDPETKFNQGLYEAHVPIGKVSFSRNGQNIETDRGVIPLDYFTPSFPSLNSNRPYSLFVTKEWLRRDKKNAISIPEEYQPSVIATQSRAVVLGHYSGRISFIHF
ncbi:vegetative incompatibility protein het-e-1 [Fusarium sporotrichioides]|uniref:Vegetative incompatibility protein het-e-1 n=1 Tax=Fusarium sporotrichioides TaxID=5514 RepID=A0A395RFZ8_FUSSP|nr:vegetative incompatibility protein het-e-1 [Fusarium sporotrichioides]